MDAARTTARERWRPQGRRGLLWVGPIQTLLGVTWVASDLASTSVSPGWLAFHIGYVLLGAALTAVVARQRVEASEAGLTKVDIRTRSFAWADIADIRPDAPHPWGQQLVLETKAGQVVELGLDHRESGPVEAWRRRTA